MAEWNIAVPEKVAQNVRMAFGDEGAAWLERLPRLIAGYAEKWSLVEIGAGFSGGYINVVAPVVRADGSEAVLKFGGLTSEIPSEIAALQAYDGDGMVRLLEADPTGGAMLMEYVRPGVSLGTLSTPENEDEMTRIAGECMRRLWRPAPDTFPFTPVRDCFEEAFRDLRARYDGGTGPFPPSLVEKAEGLYQELLASSEGWVLLHGDLHHYNILSAEREPWLVIDPKGVVGDPGYEVGQFFVNPEWIGIDTPDLKRILRRRLDVFTETLGIPRERLHGWAVAQCVLSAWWNVEVEEEDANDSVAFAVLMNEL